jgi:hypothetical protein
VKAVRLCDFQQPLSFKKGMSLRLEPPSSFSHSKYAPNNSYQKIPAARHLITNLTKLKTVSTVRTQQNG